MTQRQLSAPNICDSAGGEDGVLHSGRTLPGGSGGMRLPDVERWSGAAGFHPHFPISILVENSEAPRQTQERGQKPASLPSVFLNPTSKPAHCKRIGVYAEFFQLFMNLQVKARRAALTYLATTKMRAFAAWRAGIAAARIFRAKSQKVGPASKHRPTFENGGACVWPERVVPFACKSQNFQERGMPSSWFFQAGCLQLASAASGCDLACCEYPCVDFPIRQC